MSEIRIKVSTSQALRMGNCLMRRKRYKEAEKCFQCALNISPNDPRAFNFLGFMALKKSYEGLNTLDEALGYFRKACEFSVQLGPELVRNMALCHLRARTVENWKRAFSLLENFMDEYLKELASSENDSLFLSPKKLQTTLDQSRQEFSSGNLENIYQACISLMNVLQDLIESQKGEKQ